MKRLFKKSIRRFVPNIASELQRLVGGYDTLLDLGCGASSPLALLRDRPWSLGVDVHGPSLDASRRSGIHDRYQEMDIRSALEAFGPASFDCVLCCDVIEHLEKAEGQKLLDDMEAMAIRRVVVLTPNGFLKQEVPGQPWQTHRSSWSLEDFRTRGYQVIGAHGWRVLRGEFCEPVIRPRAVGTALAVASEVVTRRMPSQAFHLLCWKDLLPAA